MVDDGGLETGQDRLSIDGYQFAPSATARSRDFVAETRPFRSPRDLSPISDRSHRTLVSPVSTMS